MGDIAKGTWIRIKSGVNYQGVDLSNRFGVVVDSESYLIVEVEDVDIQVKILRTEVDEYMKDDPHLIFNEDENDWSFTF